MRQNVVCVCVCVLCCASVNVKVRTEVVFACSWQRRSETPPQVRQPINFALLLKIPYRGEKKKMLLYHHYFLSSAPALYSTPFSSLAFAYHSHALSSLPQQPLILIPRLFLHYIYTRLFSSPTTLIVAFLFPFLILNSLITLLFVRFFYLHTSPSHFSLSRLLLLPKFVC
jgi:hypothetical protein